MFLGRQKGLTEETIGNKEFRRNSVDISCVFYKMSHFRANEIHSVKPFIMLQIGAIWQERFVLITPLLNWLPVAAEIRGLRRSRISDGQVMQEAVENRELKRNTIDISPVFYKMSHIQANETFRVGPFVMLQIGVLGREKFVQIDRSITNLVCRWQRKLETQDGPSFWRCKESPIGRKERRRNHFG